MGLFTLLGKKALPTIQAKKFEVKTKNKKIDYIQYYYKMFFEFYGIVISKVTHIRNEYP
jgi:hypothetical protein